MLSDLRDSGSIEQDADVVLFLYRDAYYDNGEEADATTAECIVAKNRHGEVDTVKLELGRLLHPLRFAGNLPRCPVTQRGGAAGGRLRRGAAAPDVFPRRAG